MNKHRKMNSQKGFTLIELLVVIAIIGILSSIVLASLNSARTSGNDAKTKAQLSGLRASAEIYYETTGNYSSSGGCGIGMFIDPPSGMSQYTDLANYPATSQIMRCEANLTAYAVAANVGKPPAGKWGWCVDSTGYSNFITADPGPGFNGGSPVCTP